MEVMAIHTSVLAWKIPWTEKPGRVQSTGSQRVGHDSTHTLTLKDVHMGSVSWKNHTVGLCGEKNSVTA